MSLKVVLVAFLVAIAHASYISPESSRHVSVSNVQSYSASSYANHQRDYQQQQQLPQQEQQQQPQQQHHHQIQVQQQNRAEQYQSLESQQFQLKSQQQQNHYQKPLQQQYQQQPQPLDKKLSYANPMTNDQINYPVSATDKNTLFPAVSHVTYTLPQYQGEVSVPQTNLANKLISPIDHHYITHPQYSYAYDVQDAVTGDSKNHHESRSGNTVRGSYSLIDADGTRRVVDYTADPIHGFNAIVRKEAITYTAPNKIVANIASLSESVPLSRTLNAPVQAHVPVPVPVQYLTKYSTDQVQNPIAYTSTSSGFAYAAPLPYLSKFSYSSPYIHYKN